MNKSELDILNYLKDNIGTNQRIIAENLNISLGLVNKIINKLIKENYIDDNYNLTQKSKLILGQKKPKCAIILAAGFGTRMVPINLNTPKALLEIRGESLIDRLIKQLHEKGIKEIYVVVGFMKEKFEYLIDKYNVKLVVNTEYNVKNNLYSLNLVKDKINNCYIIPSDIYCMKNPFNEYELYSWYMLSDKNEYDSNFKICKNGKITYNTNNLNNNKAIGIAYISYSESKILIDNINKMINDIKYDNSFWEDALFIKNKMIVYGKICDKNDAFEINTYEELRELDKDSNNLKNDAIEIIKQVLNVEEHEICDITSLKKGMTNRSFLFKCKNKKYIMRIPGEGTDLLINRKEEADVYNAISNKNICDKILYINKKNGYKITEYIENSRNCDSHNQDDLIKCMKFLKKFHNLKLKVNHEFDIFKQIDFYEKLYKESDYKDYYETKKNVLSLKKYISKNIEFKCLTHIDAVPDNFLIYKDQNGREQIKLIDFEYSGMQDPHVDIAMFCIYALYDKKQVDNLIDIYFNNKCSKNIRIKIYCYISACGLLWSNWCEYKKQLGIEFGEYSLAQYRYAKDYYKIVKEELGGLHE